MATKPTVGATLKTTVRAEAFSAFKAGTKVKVVSHEQLGRYQFVEVIGEFTNPHFTQMRGAKQGEPVMQMLSQGDWE